MSLEAYLARRLGRAATPATPAENQGLQPEPAQTLACTPATPETRKTAASAANDAGRPLPGVIVPAADPFDRGQFGVECLSWLHAQGLVLALEYDHIVMHGTAPPLIREEAAALIELHHDDLLAALLAQEAAQTAIQRAARACWQCRHLHPTSDAVSRLPRCDVGHPLVYRTAATRTLPGRLDARPCGDRKDAQA